MAPMTCIIINQQKRKIREMFNDNYNLITTNNFDREYLYVSEAELYA